MGEEEVGNKSGFLLGAKIQGKALEPPMDTQKLQKSPQEAKGVPGFFTALKLCKDQDDRREYKTHPVACFYGIYEHSH